MGGFLPELSLLQCVHPVQADSASCQPWRWDAGVASSSDLW